MGLDMNAFSSREHIAQVDFAEPADSQELAYWRKHPNLHGWMLELYETKGGMEVFNCVPVRLDAEDIDELEIAVLTDTLPSTSGFFFGESQPENKQDDLAFIAKARAALAAGCQVYYTSWW